MQRSIERDYDINYHKRAIEKHMLEILDHLRCLREVEYFADYEIYKAMGQLSAAQWEI